MEVGDRSGKTFNRLWQRIRIWESRKYFTDGYYIYAIYIPGEKHLVLPKTQLTRVEGENYEIETLFSSVASSDIVLFKINSDAEIFRSIVDALFKI